MTSEARLDEAFRLDPVHEQMLDVALLRDGRAGARWRALRREIELDDLWDGKALDLLPMVYRALLDEGADDPDLPRLRGVHRRTWFVNQLRFQALGAGLQLLSDAAVETIVLKGAAWALTAYPDVGLRPMHDCDVLVRPDAVETALAALERGGWERQWTLPKRHALRHHEIDVRDPEQGVMDLHWHISFWLVRPGEEWTAEDPFWRRAVALDIAGVETRALDPTDALLHAVLHAAWAGWRHAPQWVPDVTFIVGDGSTIEWDRLVDVSVRANVALPVRRALDYVARRFAVPIPVMARGALDVPTAARTRRCFARLERPHPEDGRRGPFGALADTYAWWLKQTAPVDRWTAMRTFPGWLADHWDAGSPWRLPEATFRRVVARLTGSRAAPEVNTRLAP